MRFKNTFTLCLIFLSFQLLIGQTLFRKGIKGNVTATLSPLSEVNIFNLNSKQRAVTDVQGDFIIEVREGDVLLVSAVNVMAQEITIGKKAIFDGRIGVIMEYVTIQLDEVVIKEASKISAESVGAIPNGQKRYTQAERHLQTAGDFRTIMLLGLLSGSMPLDPLINKINGRTKRLKKIVVLESKIAMIEKLDEYFNHDFYNNKLNLPIDYIDGFKFYIIENNTFVSYLKNNNIALAKFLAIELAANYKEIIKSENP
jgi:hypothetical protein